MKQSVLIIPYLLLALLAGCENPPKKESDQNLYLEILNGLSQTESELNEMGIDLNSQDLHKNIQRDNFKADRKALEIKKMDPDTKDALQETLEKYVEPSHKLFQLANSKIVLFKERESLLVKHKIASYYLGHIYSELDWSSHENLPSFWEVDYAEFNIRFSRMHAQLKQISEMGFPDGTKTEIIFPKARKDNTKQFEKAIAIYSSLSKNARRLAILSEKNNDFGITKDGSLKRNMGYLVQAFMALEWSAREQLK